MESLRDKVVIITGASSGIGAGTAVFFAKLGTRLSLTGRNQSNLENVAKQCKEAGLSQDKILTVPGDINDDGYRKRLVSTTVEKFGRLDVLVNNAGVMHLHSISETPPDIYGELMDTNVKAPIFLSQLAIPHLIKSKGNIVNISSINSTMASPMTGTYSMTKAALDMCTKCLALELAPQGVRVNSVNPGVVPTKVAQRGPKRQTEEESQQFMDMAAKHNPLGKNGTPEDIAWAVAFLACDTSSFITGECVKVDGGSNYVGVV